MKVPDERVLAACPSVYTNMLQVLSFIVTAGAVSVFCHVPVALVVAIGCRWNHCDGRACVRVIDIVGMRLTAACTCARTRL